MPTVRIPTPLRKLTDGEATVECEGDDVRTIVARLDAAHPGLGARILDEDGELRRFVNVFVRDEDIRFQSGLDTAVGEDDTVSIIPAVAGGLTGPVDDMSTDAWLAHAGGGADPATGAVVPPIPMSTTFARDDAYALASAGHEYVRDDDDAVRRVETVVARLEGAAATLAFGSGMAAIVSVVRSLPPGATLVLQSSIYWGATAALRRLTAHHGIDLVEVDCTDTAVATAAIARHEPDLVLVEALSNPLLGVVDVAALALATHAHGGVLAVDATVPTPLSLRPLELGADLALHSATKSLNGHSDVLAGLVSSADTSSRTWQFLTAERSQAGAVLGPVGAWLLLRGLRTLPLRHDRSCASAQALAIHLAGHSAVDRVLYPGLADHPGHELAADQCSRGFGGLLSVLVRGGAEDPLQVAGALQLCVRATSLGGVETLVEHRQTVEQGVTDVPGNLLRVSVGIEPVDDLVADWDRALAAAN